MKHTPGPWKTMAMIMSNQHPGPEAHKCPDFWAIVSDDKIITELKPCEWRPFPEDDARLIAAAPDMYAALKRLVADDESVSAITGLDIIAAIEKAEGKDTTN